MAKLQDRLTEASLPGRHLKLRRTPRPLLGLRRSAPESRAADLLTYFDRPHASTSRGH
jgi:hypothetical protein